MDGDLVEDGGVAFTLRDGALPECDDRGHYRGDQQHYQGSDATTSQPHSAPVLVDMLTDQHVLGDFAYGRTDVSHGLPQPWVGLVHLVHVV
ncbi:MAG: hypothetical protein WCC38_13075 [Pseudonocardiaceae bacterium]